MTDSSYDSTRRDPLPDRIGNTLRSAGLVLSVLLAASAIGWVYRGEIMFYDASHLDGVDIWIGCAVLYSIFRTADYLVSGRK